MRNILTSKGYTLIDALFQLLVLMLFSQIIFFYTLWMKDSERLFLQREEEEWELFSLDVEQFLINVQHLEEQANQSGIRIIQNEVEYDIEFTGTQIRKQKNRLGHEPMLLHITKGEFQIIGNKLTITVEFDNGMTKERMYEVLLSPE